MFVSHRAENQHSPTVLQWSKQIKEFGEHSVCIHGFVSHFYDVSYYISPGACMIGWL